MATTTRRQDPAVEAEVIYAAVLGALADSFPYGLGRDTLLAVLEAAVELPPRSRRRRLAGALRHLAGWWMTEEVEGTVWVTAAVARAWQLSNVSPTSSTYTLRVDDDAPLVTQTFAALLAAIGEETLQRASRMDASPALELSPVRRRVGLAQQAYDLLLQALASQAGATVEAHVLGARWVITRPTLAHSAERRPRTRPVHARAS